MLPEMMKRYHKIRKKGLKKKVSPARCQNFHKCLNCALKRANSRRPWSSLMVQLIIDNLEIAVHPKTTLYPPAELPIFSKATINQAFYWISNWIVSWWPCWAPSDLSVMPMTFLTTCYCKFVEEGERIQMLTNVKLPPLAGLQCRLSESQQIKQDQRKKEDKHHSFNKT